MIGILAKKIGMSRLVDDKGHVIPVTLVRVIDNTVTQIKTIDNDGYCAVAVGVLPYEDKKGIKYKYVKEFRLEEDAKFEKGQVLNIKDIKEADIKTVTIQGISKGKGFAGVIKKHNFSCGPMSHGSHHHRAPGSVGTMKPNRVRKGRKLPGRMGNKQITLKDVPVVKIVESDSILAIKGPLPGPINGLIKIWS